MVPRSALLMSIGTQGPTGIWHMPTYNIHRQVKKHPSVGLGQWIAGSTGAFLLGYLYFITAGLKLNVHIDHLYKD